MVLGPLLHLLGILKVRGRQNFIHFPESAEFPNNFDSNIQACRGYEIFHPYPYPYPQTPNLRACSPQFLQNTAVQERLSLPRKT